MAEVMAAPMVALEGVLGGRVEGLTRASGAEQIVGAINAIHQLTALVASVSIGRLIVDVYYDGSFEKYRGSRRQGADAPTLDEVVEELKGAQVELGVSTSYLSDAVRMAYAYEVLPEDVRDAIAVSHYRLLMRLEEKKWASMAKKVVDKGLTVRQLEGLVSQAKTRPGGKKRGRKPDIGFKRVVTQLGNLQGELDLAEIDTLDDEALYQQVDEAEWRRTIEEAEAFMARTGEAIERLREKLGLDAG